MEIQNILKKIAGFAAKDPDIIVVWIYGSRARGTEHENSDFDLAIAYKSFSLNDLDKLVRPSSTALDWANELGIAETKISCVDINKIPSYLAFNVINEGWVIYGAESERLLREEQRIASQFEYQTVELNKLEIKNG